MDSGTRGPGTVTPPIEPPPVDGRATAARLVEAPPATPPKARRGLPRPILYVVGLVVILAIAGFGYRAWFNSTHFVSTDNAQVAGSIIAVGPTTAGQVTEVLTDVGQHVSKGQVVARVAVPQTQGVTASGAPQVVYSNTANQIVEVTAPLDGTVVARLADPGSTLAPGQPIIEVIDPTALYVLANVDESNVDRVQVGEPVDVTVDSLGTTLPGRVVAITPASAASFALIPQQNTTGNFTKVSQVVPVKIAVDYGSHPLILGSSVEVNIHVR